LFPVFIFLVSFHDVALSGQGRGYPDIPTRRHALYS
jgi:hypothetical protein